MKPVNETALLLVVVIAGAVLSTAAWQWPGSWGIVATYGGALVAGMAAGRVTGIVRRATA